MTTVVNVWSGPRNVSTALLYAFRERSDTAVVDEPLYAAWLAANPDLAPDHPGHEDVLASQPTDPWAVVRSLLRGDHGAPVLVAKQMAAHLTACTTDDGRLDLAWLDACRNVVLVRSPDRVVASYTERIDAPTVDALGYPMQVRLVERALERGERPLVLETGRLLADPPGVLGRLCTALGLPFEDTMLSWDAGPVPEDGVWAEHWYAATHRSTGFAAPRERGPVELTGAHAEVALAARPLYDRIAAHAL